MNRHHKQLALSDIESFLQEVIGALAPQGIRGRTLTPGGRTEPSLESHWLTHFQRLGVRYHQVYTGRAALDARRVQHLEVRHGRISAAHGKYNILITVDPPSGDLTAVREHLAGQASKGRQALLEPLLARMAAHSAVVLPPRHAIHSRCTCPLKRKTCRHVLGVLNAFAARLDAEPELLLRLRGLERLELCPGPLLAEQQPLTGDLAAIFGIDLEPGPAPARAAEQTTAAPPPAEQKEVRREHLRVLGLPPRTIDAWLREGILGRTTRRDVYLRSAEANHRIALRLAR